LRRLIAPVLPGADVQGNTTLNFQPAVLIKVESSAAPEAGSGVLLDGDGDIVLGSGGRR
jgi:hypothetical protein